MSKPFVAILMGSDSDLPTMQTTIDVLKKLQVPIEVKITSAHRTPQRTSKMPISAVVPCSSLLPD
jgi:5-(carboxyamino)imidazole ribonucleotide mutase